MSAISPSIALILLAAGSSSRYGSPKQLLRIDKETLVRRAAREALICDLRVVVVTGASAAPVSMEVADMPLACVHNADWEQGMGGSIACGMRELLRGTMTPDAAIVSLVDQPLIGHAQFQQLIDAHRATPQAIIAADHGSTLGPPCLFPAAYFAELARLSGAQGARRVIEAHRPAVITLNMPEAAVDIDTPADYATALFKLGH